MSISTLDNLHTTVEALPSHATKEFLRMSRQLEHMMLDHTYLLTCISKHTCADNDYHALFIERAGDKATPEGRVSGNDTQNFVF